MLTTIYSKSKKLFPIAFVAFGIAMLASCSSSNQMASSFSKRKYTTGHFSDPVAKVNTINKPVNAVSLTAPVVNNTVATNSEFTKTEKTAEKPKFSVSTKANDVAKINSVASLNASKQNGFAIAKSSVLNNSNNVSLKEATRMQEGPAYGDHGGGGGDRPHHKYLLDWLLCIAIGLICEIIAVAGAAGGSLGALIIFAILAYLAFIAALVFFILWIIQIAS